MLADVAAGSVSVEEAFERLRALPYESVEGAHVDHHRGIRQGVPEVIFGEASEISVSDGRLHFKIPARCGAILK